MLLRDRGGTPPGGACYNNSGNPGAGRPRSGSGVERVTQRSWRVDRAENGHENAAGVSGVSPEPDDFEKAGFIMAKLTLGQVLLVVCCGFYLVWWSLSYRPGTTVNRLGGLNGLLFFLTAAAGLAGFVLTVAGIHIIPHEAAKLRGSWVMIAGAVLYAVLALFTAKALARPVTTELFLFTGWAVLECLVVNVMNAAGALPGKAFPAMLSVIAVCFVVSLALYIVYYRLEEWKAFYTAMIPLIAVAAGMVIILAVSRRS